MNRYRYPAYKHSGVEWIGDIPKHWKVYRLKQLAASGPNTFVDGDWIESKNITTHGIRYITTGNIGSGTFRYQGSGYISEETFVALNCTELFPGDLVISRLFSPIGRCCMLPDLGTRVVTSVDNVILRPNDDCYKPFLNYYFNWTRYNEASDLMARGTTLERISRTMLGNNPVLLPPLEEQKLIVDYLDEKTVLIDDTIRMKQRLIELLQEERTALINQVVTRGLDLSVPMKPSGVEWLGDIPEHWEVKKLRHLCILNPGKRNFSNWDLSARTVFLPMEKVSENGDYTCDVLKPVGELVSGYTYFERGDILVAKITPCFENGKGAHLKELPFDFGFGSTEYHVLRALPAIIPEYLFFLTRSDRFMKIGEAQMTGAAGQKRVPTNFLQDFAVALPPHEEQTTIIAYVGQKIENIIQTQRRIGREITLLQEYRNALINEVVTGKRCVVLKHEALTAV